VEARRVQGDAPSQVFVAFVRGYHCDGITRISERHERRLFSALLAGGIESVKRILSGS
jgi:hypothetical protein